MGILDRLRGPTRETMDAEYRSTLANPSAQLMEAFGATGGYAGERVTESKAMGVTAVYRATEIISEAVGALPLKVYRKTDDDDRLEATAHRSWRMLHDKPNEHTIAHTFWSTCVAQLLLRGNAYVYKERNELDEVDSLWLMPAPSEVIWNGTQKQFVYYTPTKRVYGPEEILHITGLSLDGLVGVSRITYCRETLSTTIGRARFEGEFYGQGASFAGVIEYPGRLGEQGTKNLAEAMQQKHHGPGRRHKTPVLEEGASFKPVGMSMADMQFVESAQLSRSDIATLFGLPAAYLNASSGDSLTYATTESNQIQFAQQAVAPWTNRIAKAVSNDPEILPQNIMYAEFVLEGLLRADMKTRAEYWASMKSTLGLKPEFIAARENIPKSALEKPKEPVAPPALDGMAPLQLAPPQPDQAVAE